MELTEHQELYLYKALFNSPSNQKRIERAKRLIKKGLSMEGMWTRKDKMMFYIVRNRLLESKDLKEIL